jgi:hypothetical protein
VRLLPVDLAPLRSPTVEKRGGSPPVLPVPPAGSIEIELRGGTKIKIDKID